MKVKFLYYLQIALALSALVSCDFLEPEVDNTREADILNDAAYFCGPLNAVYSNLPNMFDVEMEVMTDNAVIRNFSGEYYKAGIGAMTPNNNPLSCWDNCYKNIRLLNMFLEKMVLNDATSYRTPIRFFALNSEGDYVNNMNIFYRLKGEAYALRAYWQFQLLRNYAGEGVDGQMLGVPYVGDKILDQSDNLMIPRAALDVNIAAIVADCDSAIIACRLPDLYTGTADVVYNQTMSTHISGAAAKAIKARALLFAASPAYNTTNDPAKWEAAAIAAGEAVKAAGGINTAFLSRNDYYFAKINITSFTQNNVIMKGPWVTGNRTLESDNYPSALYGDALVNVSQNLVDAFTDAQGYPISESNLYDPAKPYANRDPRLDQFVGYNGGKIGSYVLDISESGSEYYIPTKAASRSGYYLKKALRCDQVVLGPSNKIQGTPRACIIIGLPDILLMYAEAANEAWGVNADPMGFGFTAKTALNKILTRDGAKGNGYLNTVVGTDPFKFRDYVRLQRRIELCFEGQYYYDLRRWYAADQDWQDKINVDVYGVRLGAEGYETSKLESRFYLSAYPPIPYSEVYNAGLIQNKGWN